jgi:hypothetical protein
VRDHLLQLVAGAPLEQRRNLAREYLQLYLLRCLHEQGALGALVFVGGTALRLLHQLPRFSEDLDFSQAGGAPSIDATALLRPLRPALESAGYACAIKLKADRVVASARVRFDGLPAALGLTRDPRLALSIKLEVDLNPPSGAGVVMTLIHRFFPVALTHADLPSLFAGKLHALLARPWTKGRDWYDLAWYLTEQRGLAPNPGLLKASLEQTGHPVGWAREWRLELGRRLRQVDHEAVVRDLMPFVERPAELDMVRPEVLGRLLEA